MSQPLSTRAQRVLTHLREIRSTSDTNTVLGDAIGAKKSTIRAAISELEDAGLVDVELVRCSPELPSGRIVTLAEVTA
ncbi:hypothetical protein [Nocardioides sp. HB32]